MGKKPRDGFYKREDGNPYWWTRDPVTGKRCSTGFKDKEAARRWRAARERMAADPAHAAAEAATLGEWCGRFVAWKNKSSSTATVSVAQQKLGHWVRLFGSSASLSTFAEPGTFDHYVTTRRSEGPSDHTISKEVAHMLAVLKLAKRAKCFSGDLSTLRPPDLHAGYKPRKRALNRQELARLLAALEPRRGALVAVCVALGCRLGEAFRLLPTDITAERVFLRGTKTAESERFVPVLSLFKPLLAAAVGYLPLEPWGKVQRDLKVACKRAGIDPCSPNDLRRTHATLLAEAGVDADVTRRLLGHTTRNLVDRVYGQPSTESLAGLAEVKLLGAAPLLPEALQGSEGRDTSVEAVASGEPEPLPEKAGILYANVTDAPSHLENIGKAPVAQWTEQRFPKAKGEGWEVGECAGFGRELCCQFPAVTGSFRLFWPNACTYTSQQAEPERADRDCPAVPWTVAGRCEHGDDGFCLVCHETDGGRAGGAPDGTQRDECKELRETVKPARALHSPTDQFQQAASPLPQPRQAGATPADHLSLLAFRSAAHRWLTRGVTQGGGL